VLLSSFSKHNMWSYYDWVVVVVRQWTQYVVVLWSYCVYRRKTTTTQSKYDHILCLLTNDNNDNPIIIRPHIAFTDGRQQQPNHNTTTYCAYWRTTTTQYVVVLWLGCRCRPSVNTICGRVMIGLSLLSSVSKHNMRSIIRPHIVFTDGRQRQPNHNTTTYCVYWRTTTTTTQS
jgi:ribosomal protein L11 methylase PrmA